MPKVIGIIPSRYESKRFPGKPLTLIAGVPLIVHVMRAAEKATRIDDVYVATDNRQIADTVSDHGGKAIITTGLHATGSDRVAEAAAGLEADYIVNIQGDEPFLDPEVIDSVVQALDSRGVVMSSACAPLTDLADADNPNLVKVIMDKTGRALYFSRSRIPYQRSDSAKSAVLYRHIGIYGFKRDFLFTFASLPRTPLEMTESLEQLRALEHGYAIKMVVAKCEFAGIDSMEDVPRAEEILSKRGRRDG